jgi:hypothetical protein
MGGSKTVELARLRAGIKRIVELESQISGLDHRSALERMQELRPDIFKELRKLERAEAKKRR